MSDNWRDRYSLLDVRAELVQRVVQNPCVLRISSLTRGWTGRTLALVRTFLVENVKVDAQPPGDLLCAIIFGESLGAVKFRPALLRNRFV